MGAPVRDRETALKRTSTPWMRWRSEGKVTTDQGVCEGKLCLMPLLDVFPGPKLTRFWYILSY